MAAAFPLGMIASGIGTGISAMGTLAGGSFARQAGQMQQQAADVAATQQEMNASQAIAAGTRQALDTRLKTQLAISTSKANAAGGGIETTTGSPAANAGQLASRGSYLAGMDLFRGESAATGLKNQAADTRYSGQAAAIEGEEAQSASELAAAGTIAGGAGSMFSNYGKYYYPSSRGATGASL